MITNKFQQVTESTEGRSTIQTITGDFPWKRIIVSTPGKKISLKIEFQGRVLNISPLQNIILSEIEKNPEGVTSIELHNAASSNKLVSIHVDLSVLRANMRYKFEKDLLEGRAGNNGVPKNQADNTKYYERRLTYRRDLKP